MIHIFSHKPTYFCCQAVEHCLVAVHSAAFAGVSWSCDSQACTEMINILVWFLCGVIYVKPICKFPVFMFYSVI